MSVKLKAPNDALQWLIEQLRARQIIGMERYGRPLTPLDGRNNLQDAMEEALDLAAYLAKEQIERSAIEAESSRLLDVMREALRRGCSTPDERCGDPTHEALRDELTQRKPVRPT